MEQHKRKVCFLQGNEAVAEGAIAAGIGFFAGYPITPATEIAEVLSRRIPQTGGKFIQMEDELACMGAVCGASLVENTIHAEHYLEEGYLPQWQVYQKWLASTVNQELVILELGEGFLTPTVIRWPFEKTVYFNRKAWMFRVNENFYQISAEIKDRASAVHENSVKWISELVPVSKLC